MNRWDDLIGLPRADRLRSLICEAAGTAHTANGARHAPEDLGDNALIYGTCTTHNARYLASQFIEDSDVEGVAACERGRVWWLEIQRPDGSPVHVYLYKAPPGARTVWDLSLDDAEIKKELSTSNGRQLELFNRNGGEGHAQLLNLIVVHYGDPITGLEKLEVGAPYVADGVVAWEWDERFDTVDRATAAPSSHASSSLGDDGSGYTGLRLVTPASPEESHQPDEAASKAEPEPATSEFEALELRDDQEEDARDEGAGKEPS